MVVKHGVSETSANKILIDAGAIYFGFKDADNPGTLLGATRGGNSFELARTIRRMEADGAKGPVKGLRRIEEVAATIKANMLELTAENLRRAIAGAIYTAGVTTITAEANGVGDAEPDPLKLFQLGMLLDDCEAAWDEVSIDGVAATADPTSHRRGTNGAKMVVDEAVDIGRIASRIVSINGALIVKYKKLNLRIKSSIDLDADDIEFRMSSTGALDSPEVTVKIPALVADQQYNLIIDHDFSKDDGLASATMVSLGIWMTVNKGAFDLYIDDVRCAATQIEENSETIAVEEGPTQVRGTHYTMDYDKGIIQFVTAPPDGKAVTATYDFVSGAAVIGSPTAELARNVITGDAYIDNVVIVGTITGKTNPVIVKITNALCDAGFSLALAPKDEAVPEVTFTAHYAIGTLDTEPWSIEYPAS
ncbi:hypothetical protein ES708_11665 [subsurface metagenome]